MLTLGAVKGRIPPQAHQKEADHQAEGKEVRVRLCLSNDPFHPNLRVRDPQTSTLLVSLRADQDLGGQAKAVKVSSRDEQLPIENLGNQWR